METMGVSAGDPLSTAPENARQTVGRYVLYGPISSGGMASVHFGRLRGPIGFRRTVAIKRLHGVLAVDAEQVAMFLEEARLAARIHHPNVVGPLDVVEADGEHFLVMEYVRGISLSGLVRMVESEGGRVRPAIAVAILIGALHGLHAAHEATSESGEPLGIVHRDVSPQNILVGEEGVARVIDFGIAKAVTKAPSTGKNEIRGKLLYMAPEQLTREAPVDRRTDIYAAAVVLWEALTGHRYLATKSNSHAALIMALLDRRPEAPSAVVSGISHALDAVVLRGLSRRPEHRFATALEMAAALEAAIQPASQREVAEWVSGTAGETLRERAAILRAIESDPRADDDGDPARDAVVLPSSDLVSGEQSGPVDETTAWRQRTLHIHAMESTAMLSTVASSHTLRSSHLPSGPTALGHTPPHAQTAQVWVEAPMPSSSGASARRGAPPRRFDRRPLLAVGGIAVVVLAWSFGTLHGRTPGSDATAGAPDLPSAAVFPAAPELPPAVEPAAAQEPSAEVPLAQETGAVTSTPTPAPATLAPPSGTPSPRSTAKAIRPAPRSGHAACSPPFTVVDGIRIPKKECL